MKRHFFFVWALFKQSGSAFRTVKLPVTPHFWIVVFRMSLKPSLTTILRAYERVHPHVHRTPVLTSSAINKLTGCNIYFKMENFQKCGAFKARGSFPALLHPNLFRTVRVSCRRGQRGLVAVGRTGKTRGCHPFLWQPCSCNVHGSSSPGYSCLRGHASDRACAQAARNRWLRGHDHVVRADAGGQGGCSS